MEINYFAYSLKSYKMKRAILYLFGILWATLPVSVLAQMDGHVRAQLVSEVEWVQPGKAFDVALHLEMDAHWHTYFKEPGSSGYKCRG